MGLQRQISVRKHCDLQFLRMICGQRKEKCFFSIWAPLTPSSSSAPGWPKLPKMCNGGPLTERDHGDQPAHPRPETPRAQVAQAELKWQVRAHGNRWLQAFEQHPPAVACVGGGLAHSV